MEELEAGPCSRFREMSWPLNWVQATPDCAGLLFPSQRSGAPDPERYA